MVMVVLLPMGAKDLTVGGAAIWCRGGYGIDKAMLRFHKNPSFGKITKTGVLALGSMGFIFWCMEFNWVLVLLPKVIEKGKYICLLKKNTLKIVRKVR